MVEIKLLMESKDLVNVLRSTARSLTKSVANMVTMEAIRIIARDTGAMSQSFEIKSLGYDTLGIEQFAVTNTDPGAAALEKGKYIRSTKRAVPPQPFLRPAAAEVKKALPKMFRKEFEYRLAKEQKKRERS